MRIQLADFTRKPATHIVSLGVNCSVAYNLRRYFNFGGAFPFDWWISEGDGLARFLAAPDIDSLYNLSNLELTANSGSVRHRIFGFLFHHEFKRHWDLPGVPVQDGWQHSTETPRHRTLALFDKFVRLDDSYNRICFFRNEELSPGLIAALDQLFSRPEWTIVKLNSSYSPSDWKGNSTRWDEELSSLGIALDLHGHKPFIANNHTPELESRPDVEV